MNTEKVEYDPDADLSEQCHKYRLDFRYFLLSLYEKKVLSDQEINDAKDLYYKAITHSEHEAARRIRVRLMASSSAPNGREID